MNDKTQAEGPQTDVQKLADDELKDVNGGWGPVSNRFFDQLISAEPKGAKDAGNTSGQIKK